MTSVLELRQPIPFTPALLPADEALWGTFWQGDVIAPGYRLPALELWFLRATWLEKTFSDATPAEFLDTLQSIMLAGPSGTAYRFATEVAEIYCVNISVFGENIAASGPYKLCVWLANDEIIGAHKDFPPHVPLSPYLEAQLSLVPEQLSKCDAEWDTLPIAEKLDYLVWFNRAHLANPTVNLILWLENHRAK